MARYIPNKIHDHIAFERINLVDITKLTYPTSHVVTAIVLLNESVFLISFQIYCQIWLISLHFACRTKFGVCFEPHQTLLFLQSC